MKALRKTYKIAIISMHKLHFLNISILYFVLNIFLNEELNTTIIYRNIIHTNFLDVEKPSAFT